MDTGQNGAVWMTPGLTVIDCIYDIPYIYYMFFIRTKHIGTWGFSMLRTFSMS